MKRLQNIGFLVLVFGLFTSLINAPNGNEDLKRDKDIDQLIISANAKIVNIKDATSSIKKHIDSDFNTNRIIIREEE